ncbi:hypothetical protein K1719_035994 [Acacia pycnantha]|nr:hypothetical protein K1719_035994 [Acacia pycnantha]
MQKGKLFGLKGTLTLVVLGVALVVLPLLLPPLPPPPMILMVVPLLMMSLLISLFSSIMRQNRYLISHVSETMEIVQSGVLRVGNQSNVGEFMRRKPVSVANSTIRIIVFGDKSSYF